jgi:hypothetical protein
MPTSPPKFEACAESVTFGEYSFVVQLSEGRTLSVPYVWFSRLADATARQCAMYELTTSAHRVAVDLLPRKSGQFFAPDAGAHKERQQRAIAFAFERIDIR